MPDRNKQKDWLETNFGPLVVNEQYLKLFTNVIIKNIRQGE